MGKVFDEIDASIQKWIQKQHMFFVSTAPRSDAGHINCSPKGLNAFRILNTKQVAYQDLTGSGIETIAHLRENGRILIMFCAFEGPPNIVRLHGTGQFFTQGSAEFEQMLPLFPEHVGTRSLIRIDVQRVSTSCGFSVPHYDYVGQRDVLDKWAEEKGTKGVAEYRQRNNRLSIDGLPGLDAE